MYRVPGIIFLACLCVSELLGQRVIAEERSLQHLERTILLKSNSLSDKKLVQLGQDFRREVTARLQTGTL